MTSSLIRISSAAFILIGGLSAATAQTSPIQQGSSLVSTGEYRFAAKVDPDVLPGKPIELWARAFWPKDLSSGKRPLLILLHGNHSTCSTQTSPRRSAGCEYTTTGSCPAGSVITRNHEGFNYIGENLASHGYVVVSINANRGITCGSGPSEDMGLILARGRLVLRHLELWTQWNRKGGAPSSLGVSDQAFVNRIDFSNIGLFGHSRGAEGVRAAYVLSQDPGNPWKARIPDLKVRGIFEVGATDGFSARTLDALGVAWNQLLPMCDGDISDMSGRRPFERMMKASVESGPQPKSLYMVWGANHNFFNSEWHQNDSFACDSQHRLFDPSGWQSEKQRLVALAAVGDFFRAHVGTVRSPILARHFDPLYALPEPVASVTPVDRDLTLSPAEIWTARVEEFDRATGQSSYGQSNLASGVEIEHLSATASLPARARLSWKSADDANFFQTNWAPEGQGKSMDGFATLDFRVSRLPNTLNVDPQTAFTIRLVNADGTLSSAVHTSAFGSIRGPVQANLLFQTIRVPLSVFQLVRLDKIRGVRFIFDQTPQGALMVANLRLSTALNFDGEPLSPLNSSAASTHQGPTPAPGLLLSRSAPTGPIEHSYTQIRIPLLRRQARVVNIGLTTEPSLVKSPTLDLTIERDESGTETPPELHPERFPVSDALPVLRIGSKKFHAIRFDNGNTRRLIVSIPVSAYALISQSNPARLWFGRRIVFDLHPLEPLKVPKDSKASAAHQNPEDY